MNLKVISKGAIALLTKRFAGPFWYRRKWLEKTQWLDEGQLQEIQLGLLQRLVKHCYDSVPYYRTLMDERAIKRSDIKTLDDIRLFPILTKTDVLKAGSSILSMRYPKWLTRIAYTGGTTGTPLQIRRNLFSIGNEHAFVRRQWDWAGISLGDRCAYLTGRLITRPDQTKGQLYSYDPIMKELVLSTYHLSPQTTRTYILAMNRWKVKAVAGYPSAVYLLARVCLDSEIELRLESALTSSETLTESMRNTIAEAFKCEVFDFYGSAERVCYIQTCDHGSYHVIPEYGLTELIPLDKSDATEFKIIATGFWNFAMPFIRYDVGDVVIKSDNRCPCGRQFPTIKSISGRQADTIKTPSGREFGAAILTHLLYGTDHIVESQIVQDATDHITIRYVPTERFSTADLQDFKNLIAKHLPSELKVTFEQTEAIEKTDTGKLRPVVSKIA